MNILKSIRLMKLGHDVINRLEREAKMGKLWTALYGLGSFVTVAVVAKVTGACPDLATAAGGMAVLSGIGAGLALWSKKRSAVGSVEGGLGAFGLLSLVYVGVKDQIALLCGVGFEQQLPTLLAGGAMIGFGLWLQSTRKT